MGCKLDELRVALQEIIKENVGERKTPTAKKKYKEAIEGAKPFMDLLAKQQEKLSESRSLYTTYLGTINTINNFNKDVQEYDKFITTEKTFSIGDKKGYRQTGDHSTRLLKATTSKRRAGNLT
jgi:hypothetical protein